MLASFALTVAVNCRGLGDAWPIRSVLSPFPPFRQELSPAATRAMFGVFAVIGACVFVTQAARFLA